jgi:catechol 2,3-dioxygenase-like lactoylglutathione lyase family enzyme
MTFDHVAVNVIDIGVSVAWYRAHLGAEVLHEDDSWALLGVG